MNLHNERTGAARCPNLTTVEESWQGDAGAQRVDEAAQLQRHLCRTEPKHNVDQSFVSFQCITLTASTQVANHLCDMGPWGVVRAACTVFQNCLCQSTPKQRAVDVYPMSRCWPCTPAEAFSLQHERGQATHGFSPKPQFVQCYATFVGQTVPDLANQLPCLQLYLSILECIQATESPKVTRAC